MDDRKQNCVMYPEFTLSYTLRGGDALNAGRDHGLGSQRMSHLVYKTQLFNKNIYFFLTQ